MEIVAFLAGIGTRISEEIVTKADPDFETPFV